MPKHKRKSKPNIMPKQIKKIMKRLQQDITATLGGSVSIEPGTGFDSNKRSVGNGVYYEGEYRRGVDAPVSGAHILCTDNNKAYRLFVYQPGSKSQIPLNRTISELYPRYG